MENKTISVNFTIEELTRLEDALYSRSDLLQTIAGELDREGKHEQADKLHERSKMLDRLAYRVGSQLDSDYVKSINKSNALKTTKPNQTLQSVA